MTSILSLRDRARSAMWPFLQRLATKPEVLGVAVLSSAALAQERSHFDHESDFDISVMVRAADWRPETWRPEPAASYRLLGSSIPAWAPNFLFWVGVPWGVLEVNVHQLVFDYEADRRTAWDHDKCDVYANKCELVYDPSGEFARLIEVKTSAARASIPLLARRLANRLSWDVLRVPVVASQRFGPVIAHDLLNNAIDELIQLLYLLHGRFIAARKWRLVTLREAGLVDQHAWERLVDALRADNTSTVDLERRIELLQGLWHQICDRFDLPDAETLRRSYLASDVQLLQRTVADEASAGQTGAAVFSAANIELWDRVPWPEARGTR